MNTFWQDLCYGFRMLRTQPGFTAVAVLTLALGIGGSSAIFTVVNAVLLRPLPFVEPEQLALIETHNRQRQISRGQTSFPDFLDWQEQQTVFSDLAVVSRWNTVLTGGDEPERIQQAYVSANFFSLLGVQPLAGRTFSPAEAGSGFHPVVVISSSLWQRRYGADPSLVGRTITLDSLSFTIIGVVPARFDELLGPIEMWSPIPGGGGKWRRDSRALQAIGRLKPGVTVAQAQAEIGAIAQRLQQAYPKTNAGWGAQVVSLHEAVTRAVRPALLVLLGAVGMVLAVACANVANLLLARAAARQKEMAIRAALGASRLRLIRQLLVESVMLAGVGGAIGLWLAVTGTDLLIRVNPNAIPRLNEISLDGRVLGFTLLISLLTGLLFGLAPALQISKPGLNETLKDGSRGPGWRRNRVRGLLVVSEFALALVLLIGAYPQNPWPVMVIVARAQADPLGLAAAIKSQVQAIDKDQPVYNVRTLEQVVAASTADRRFNLTLLAVFAAVALALAGVGIYGVMSYAVTQRTHEIGVRMALGARASDVLKLIISQGMRLALIGTALGIAGALSLTRVMAGLLFGVHATDPLTFIGVSLLLLLVALVACYLPARRAIRVEPTTALRCE